MAKTEHKFRKYVKLAIAFEYGEPVKEEEFHRAAANLVARYLELMDFSDEDFKPGELDGVFGAQIYQLYTFAKYILDEGWITIKE